MEAADFSARSVNEQVGIVFRTRILQELLGDDGNGGGQVLQLCADARTSQGAGGGVTIRITSFDYEG